MNTATAKSFTTALTETRKDHAAYDVPTIFLSADELTKHIRQCVLNDRVSQKILYNSFYRYAKSIVDCYTKRNDDSLEIVNDGFLKMFKELHRYKPAYSNVVSSFKGWLRRILIHTAIDHYRKDHKHHLVGDLTENVIHISAGYETAPDNISYKEIMDAIRELSPGYRTVLSLYIIEGLSHVEISKLLGITIGASKSNLSKARRQVQKILFQRNQIASLSVKSEYKF